MSSNFSISSSRTKFISTFCHAIRPWYVDCPIEFNWWEKDDFDRWRRWLRSVRRQQPFSTSSLAGQLVIPVKRNYFKLNNFELPHFELTYFELNITSNWIPSNWIPSNWIPSNWVTSNWLNYMESNYL